MNEMAGIAIAILGPVVGIFVCGVASGIVQEFLGWLDRRGNL